MTHSPRVLALAALLGDDALLGGLLALSPTADADSKKIPEVAHTPEPESVLLALLNEAPADIPERDVSTLAELDQPPVEPAPPSPDSEEEAQIFEGLLPVQDFGGY